MQCQVPIYQACLRLSVRTRCGFLKSKILRSGSVRFSERGNLAVRFGAVFRYCKSYGAVIYPTVRFGALFKKIGNPAVRFGAFLKN